MPFQSGQSGNPRGRTRADAEATKLIRRMARDRAEAAMAVLDQALASDNERIRVQAARDLLDRAGGRPAQMIGFETEQSFSDVLRGLSDEQFKQLSEQVASILPNGLSK